MQRRGPGGPAPRHFYTKLKLRDEKFVLETPPPPPTYLRVCVGYFDDKITLGTNY